MTDGGRCTLALGRSLDRPSQAIVFRPKGEDLINNAQVTPVRKYVERASAVRSLQKGFGRLEALGLPAGRATPHSWRVDYAGNCQQPVVVFRDGVSLAKDASPRIMGGMNAIPVMTELQVPCRKCDNCLRRRAAHWRMRAVSEWQAAHRTWFGTLTLAPDKHVRVLSACRSYCAKSLLPEARDFDALASEDQFAMRHRMINREITLFVKRIRKNSGASLRLLCVAEEHKSGLPHYHMLVHEPNPQESISKAQLEAAWKWGFSSWRLVKDPRAAGYVCKYLSKSSKARVRASLDYGDGLTIAERDPMTHQGGTVVRR